MNNYSNHGPEDDYENCQYDSDELELLTEEFMEDNDAWERSNDDGWYYDDND